MTGAEAGARRPAGAAALGLALRVRERVLDALDQPILVKELRAALRRRRFVVLLSTALGLLGLLLVGGLSLGVSLSDADPALLGRAAFLAFLGGLAVVVVVVFAAATCTAIVDEQAAGTLDLLVTTRLRPAQVAWGKLVAGVVYGLLLVVATLPLAALTFLYGGVTPWQLGLSYAALVITGVTVASYGLLVSSLSQTAARAVVRTFLALPFVCTLTLAPVVAVVQGLVVVPLQERCTAARVLADVPTPTAVVLGLATVAWPLAWSSLFLLVATERLRPELDDRDGPRRRWALAAGGAALALFCAWRLATPAGGAATGVLVEALALAAVTLATATLALVVEGPRRPGEARATGARALLRPGADGAADLVLLAAVVVGLALLAVHHAPDLASAAGGAVGAPLARVRDAGVAWLLAFALALVQGQRAVAAWSGGPRAPRLASAVALGLGLLATVPWALAETPRNPAWPGAVLSPVVVGYSVVTVRSPAQRAGVLGPSAQALDRAVEERLPPAPRDEPPAAAWLRQARREELLRELTAGDVPVHAASTGLLLAVGVALTAWRAARARRAAAR